MRKFFTGMFPSLKKPTLPSVLYMNYDEYRCMYRGTKNPADLAGYSIPQVVGKYVLVEEFKAVRSADVIVTETTAVNPCQ